MPKLKIAVDIGPVQKGEMHGTHEKDGAVMHETVSGQIMNSVADVVGVSNYVAKEGLGIHSVVDNDANIAHAKGLGQAIFYHTDSSGDYGNGHINTRKIGIELVSDVMVKYNSRIARIKAWFHMQPELNAAAKLLACLARAHEFPLEDRHPSQPGITTHWECTKAYGVRGGHVDCWPSTKGGYFPKRLLIKLAKRYYKLGYHF